jgi:hypothetical protein
MSAAKALVFGCLLLLVAAGSAAAAADTVDPSGGPTIPGFWVDGMPHQPGRRFPVNVDVQVQQGDAGPVPVTPEFPFALALPVAFAAGVGAWWLLRRRREAHMA